MNYRYCGSLTLNAIFMFRFAKTWNQTHFTGTPSIIFYARYESKTFSLWSLLWAKVKRLLQSRLPLSLIRPQIKAIRKQMPEIWIALNVIWTRAWPEWDRGTLRELGLNKHWVIWTRRIVQSQTSILGPWLWTCQEKRRRLLKIYAKNQEGIWTFDMFWDKISVSHMVERKYLV